MKAYSMFFPLALLLAHLHMSAAPQQKPLTLDDVLKKMDAVSATFHTAQAQIESQNYEKVINEVDETEYGEIYYRRAGKDLEMMLDITKPDKKSVLLSGGKIRMYQPKLEQVTEWDLGKNKSDFESYLVLGFGGSGQDLQKAFDVTFLGPETINGVATAKLQLVPKSQRVRNTFKQILLWIDLDKGISVQQQFFQPQGDYRLAKYTNIQLGKKISDEVFKLKTTGKTKTVSAGS
ncbi:MAG: outer membrane lipoprotein carrier protein LolA [Candidatus Sulfotelmatobacter sp.]